MNQGQLAPGGSVRTASETIARQHLTGRLLVKSHTGERRSLFFSMGRLVWADGGHQHRRWRRQLFQAELWQVLGSLSFKDYSHSQSLAICWDYHLLLSLFEAAKLSKEQAVFLARGMIREVLFDIYQLEFIESHYLGRNASDAGTANHRENLSLGWQKGERPSVQATPPPWLEGGEVPWDAAREQWRSWQAAGLSSFFPDLAPKIADEDRLNNLSPKARELLVKRLKGKHSCRDLAMRVNSDPLRLMRSLLPYYQQGIIGFQRIGDLELPQPPGTTSLEENTDLPLVAYVEDSASCRQTMADILEPSNYRFISIGDPIKAFSILLETRPDFIFLDLVMPLVSGYEICAQIRRMSILKKIPIAIVTGRDGLVDRARASLSGANAFISKPIQADKVLAVLNEFLG